MTNEKWEMTPAPLPTNNYLPPVISLALNFAGGGMGELVRETYCIRRSASKLSST
jgi:hypothetical protein